MSIHIDPKFGHVRVLDDDILIAEIVDYGNACDIAIHSANLSPTEAIDVGRALIKWAGNVRKRRGVGA